MNTEQENSKMQFSDIPPGPRLSYDLYGEDNRLRAITSRIQLGQPDQVIICLVSLGNNSEDIILLSKEKQELIKPSIEALNPTTCCDNSKGLPILYDLDQVVFTPITDKIDKKMLLSKFNN